MAAMNKDLNGQVALVTGASRGIGLAIAEALAAAGADVAITARTPQELDEAKRRLEAAGRGRAQTHPVDVRDHKGIHSAIADTVSAFGGLDIVINNAGVGRFANVADMSLEQWSDVIDTNLTGVFNVCHAAIPELRKRGGGYIINIGSLAGKNAFVGAAAYCASKAGLNQFGEALMQEIRHDNIRVTTIAPGSVATGFAGNSTGAADWKIAPSDIGEIVVNLLRGDPRSLASYIELRPSKPPRK
jgi:NAD(P)-dependent dehydrogenase (short-subunit alcohol dehydrogenase family)